MTAPRKRQSQSQSHTPEQWAAVKSHFRHRYLVQNKTLREIQKEFAREFGFYATERQYKTKVDAWQFDLKTIKDPIWHAMSVVLKKRRTYNLSTAFIVPIRGDELTTIRSDRITKQTHRTKYTYDSINDMNADRTLEEYGVDICNDDEDEVNARLQARKRQHPGQFFEAAPQPQWPLPPGNEWSMRNCTASLGSPLSDRPMSEPVITNNTHYGFAQRSDSVHVLGGSAARTPASPMSDLIEYNCERYPAAISSTAKVRPFDSQDIAFAISSLFLDPSCSDIPSSPSMISSKLTIKNYVSPTGDKEKQLAVRWVMPYIQTSLHRRASDHSIELNRSGRDDAKCAFKSMLKMNNRHIFPYCNWMVTVLGSNNQTVELTNFLSDTCEVIDQDEEVGYKMTYGSPMHLCLALFTKNRREIEVLYPGIDKSMTVIRMLWGVDSPNYLVSQYHWAWHLLEQNDHQGALSVLQNCLPLAHRIMGQQHVVTLNCMTIMARAHIEMGNVRHAIPILEEVLRCLQNCPDLLLAYRDRQLYRLAESQIEIDDLVSAQANILTVLKFRRDRFGLMSGATWDAIYKFIDILTRRGMGKEAGRLLRKYTDRYDREIEDEWLRRHGAPAPWLQET